VSKDGANNSSGKKHRLLKTTIQFIKFGIVGLSNTAISLAIYYIFVLINPDFYVLGNVVGAIVSIANSFYWNNRFVFPGSSTKLIIKLLKTYVAYGGSFILGTALLIIFVELIGISEYLAPILTLFITVPTNFLVNKYWTFKRTSAGSRK
jgi:putative flippase GtrA